LFRFFGIFGLPFQAEYLNQPGPKTPGQVNLLGKYQAPRLIALPPCSCRARP